MVLAVMDEREAYIALNMMEKVGPVGVRSLVSVLGSAKAIFGAGREQLMAARGIGKELAEAIVSQRDRVDWKGEIEKAGRLGGRIIAQIDEEYPAQLKEIHDPPLALNIWGKLESRDRHAIAVVGTRHPTNYGAEVTGRISYDLAKAGFVVVSGLAEGIDTLAHRAALKAKARTIAVIGSGLDVVYPPSNLGLAREIAQNGAVISEFPFGRQPDKTTFPIRNRIVSGLSMGVLVVEASRKSGAMITANQALDQGRSVFAVPGRIDSPASTGTNDLIKNGARLVSSVEDIFKEYEFLIPPKSVAQRKETPMPKLSADESAIVALLAAGGNDVDSLIRQTGLKASAVSSLLIGLEMKRVVKMLPGQIVELARGAHEE